MKIFLLENHELPLISVSARIRTGSNYEPAEKAGLADLMGTVQRTGGTKNMTGDEIDDLLANLAAFVETGVGGDSGFASTVGRDGEFQVLGIKSSRVEEVKRDLSHCRGGPPCPPVLGQRAR